MAVWKPEIWQRGNSVLFGGMGEGGPRLPSAESPLLLSKETRKIALS